MSKLNWNDRAEYGGGEAKVNITVKVHPNIKEKIQQLSKTRGVTESDVVRFALYNGLEEIDE